MEAFKLFETIQVVLLHSVSPSFGQGKPSFFSLRKAPSLLSGPSEKDMCSCRLCVGWCPKYLTRQTPRPCSCLPKQG